ncbi:MAG: mechanosensitive ion channel family protein [Candidatus Methylopumilus sp.]
MNTEMQIIWKELLEDLPKAVMLWQFAVIGASVFGAWLITRWFRSYVMMQVTANWKVGVEGLSRVLFPLSSLVLVYIGSYVLSQWQHVSLLVLTVNLLWAMAAIRLCVYGLRYIFTEGSWMRTTEHLISRVIWIVLALHLSGFWSQILSFLEEITFKVGKSHLNVLIVIQAILTILFTLFVSLSLSRMIENRMMHAERIDVNVRVVLSKLIRIALSVMAILIAMSGVGIDITLLSVFGGALGVGLGFGLQKVASNYVSGFAILLDDSVHIGDVITVDGHYGVVSELRFRYMILRKLDGTEVVIPHEILMATAVINHSYTDRKGRITMPVQVSYDSDLDQAMLIIKGIANAHVRVLESPSAEVQIKGFGENGIDLNLAFWIADPEEGYANLQSDIYLDIWRQFKKHGIVVPYPQREVRMLSTPAVEVVTPLEPVVDEAKPSVRNWDDVI